MVFERVKQYITANGLTIHSFEVMCGLGNGTVSGWENGFPRVETLKRVADMTEKPLSWWVGGDEPTVEEPTR